MGLRLKPTYGKKVLDLCNCRFTQQFTNQKKKKTLLCNLSNSKNGKNAIHVNHSRCAKRLPKSTKKKELGYFQVNSEILETQISSSSKFVPEKNSSGIFKFELEIS